MIKRIKLEIPNLRTLDPDIQFPAIPPQVIPLKLTRLRLIFRCDHTQGAGIFKWHLASGRKWTGRRRPLSRSRLVLNRSPVYWPVYPDNHVPADENLFKFGTIVQAVEQVPPDEHVFNFDANDQFAERVRILESWAGFSPRGENQSHSRSHLIPALN